MGLCHANPAFSQLAKVLTKIALEEARVVLCTPDWGTTGKHVYWRRLLDCMTVGRTELPNGPIYFPEDCQETKPAPEWGSFLSIVDGSLNTVPASDLNHVVLKALMAENRALTLLDLKKSPSTLGSLLRVVSAPMSRILQQSPHPWLMLTTA